jgi:glucose dehydrogenase
MRAVFTTTDLIFTDEITDDVLALDANDGKILYKHHVGGPIAGR